MMPDNLKPSKIIYKTEGGKEQELYGVIGIDAGESKDYQVEADILTSPLETTFPISCDLKIKRWYKKKKGKRYVYYYKYVCPNLSKANETILIPDFILKFAESILEK